MFLAPDATPFDRFVEGYIEAIFWAEQAYWFGDENDIPHIEDCYDYSDVENMDEVRKNCFVFVDDHLDDLTFYAEEFGWKDAGINYYLTRQRHGTGFWDKDYSDGELRDVLLRLTEACHAAGEVTVEPVNVGDDSNGTLRIV